MNFVFKFDKVKLIQFFILLMIVFSGNSFPAMRGNLKDCVFFGSQKNAHEIDGYESETGHFRWKITISEFSKNYEDISTICDGILISNKHALVAASCLLKGQDPLVLRTNTSSLPYIARLPDETIEGISKIYVHQNYRKSSHDFDISIIEFRRFIQFRGDLMSQWIYPAILPQASLAIHNRNQLYVAIEKRFGEINLYERTNGSIWSKDECAPNADHLMCIETDSNCDNWVQPNTFSMQNTSTIFYISNDNGDLEFVENFKMEIFGIPLGCKRIGSPISKSALVYLRVADFLPWIQNIIFNGGAECVIKTANFLDAVEF